MQRGGTIRIRTRFCTSFTDMVLGRDSTVVPRSYGGAGSATIITDCLVPGCHLANLSRIGEIAQIGLARVNSPSLLLVCYPDIILKLEIQRTRNVRT